MLIRTLIAAVAAAVVAVVLAGFAAGPQATADDNCVARSIGSLCRNPDNSLTYCGVGPLSTCSTIRPDQVNLLGPGPVPPPAPGF